MSLAFQAKFCTFIFCTFAFPLKGQSALSMPSYIQNVEHATYLNFLLSWTSTTFCLKTNSNFNIKFHTWCEKVIKALVFTNLHDSCNVLVC